MSISQEDVPESVDEELREFLARRFIDIAVALDKPSRYVERKEMPYKPQQGSIFYFGNPGTHNYDPAITSEGWWGLKSTGWVLIA